MANTYIPDRWLDKLDNLPARDFKILLSAIFKGEDEPEISVKYQHIADEIFTEIDRMRKQKQATQKCRGKHYGDITVRLQSYYSNITVTEDEKKEKVPPLSSPSSSPPHPLIITPYNPPNIFRAPPFPPRVFSASAGVICASARVDGAGCATIVQK